MIKMVGACPVCGQPMDEMSVRQTSQGTMCAECVFKRDYERRQHRGAAMAMAGAGQSPTSAPASSDGVLLGFLAGFLCGVLGLLVVWITSQSSKMKKAAIAGIVVQVVLGVLVRIAYR